MKTYYTIYKITNKLNGKIYIGMHQTKNLNDGYYGSGKLIQRSIEKHGIDNFTKEYLAVFDDKSEMIDLEKELVNEDFVRRDDVYNIAIGGEGGWDHLNDSSSKHIERCIKCGKKGGITTAEKLKNDLVYKTKMYNIHSEQMKKRWALGQAHALDWTGRHHTEETKKKIGKANSKHQKGKSNSQYGTCWICNVELQKNIKINSNETIPEDWIRGRNKWVIPTPIIKESRYKQSKYAKCLSTMIKDFNNGYVIYECFTRSGLAFNGPLYKKFKKDLNI